MTATISQARTALAAALVMDGVQVNAFPPGAINVPALVITPSQGEFLSYKDSFDGQASLTLIVTAFSQRGQERSSNEELDAFLAQSGARSVFAAVENNPTLGGVVSSAAVLSAGNYGSFTFAGAEYLGIALTVEIYL